MWKKWIAVLLLASGVIAGVVMTTKHFGAREPINRHWIKQMALLSPAPSWPAASERPSASATATASPTAPPAEQTAPPASDGRIHLNTATVDELDQLPGIGPAKAADILDYRRVHGRFGRLDELKLIKGIGEKTYDKLAPMLVLN
jgi:comEA protein